MTRRMVLVLLVCLTWVAGWAVPEVEPPDCSRPSLMTRSRQVQVAQRLELSCAAHPPTSQPVLTTVAPAVPQVEATVQAGPRAPPV